ncbi:MAG TPA: hypothetical protein DDW52_12055 [Planctomycetaceae bacterium]|nr:hypothetical protein [Planctomycetaceae bacterium]
MRIGLTLIEVVVVTIIIAIVAVVAIPIVDSRVNEARLRASVRQMQIIVRACELYRATSGSWPANTDSGVVPPEIADSLGPIDFSTTPLGGTYDWNGPGTSVGSLGISIRFASSRDAPLPDLLELDCELDNGDLNTGAIRLFRGRYFQFCVE